MSTLRWIPANLNPAEFQHTQSGLQQPPQRSALETSSFLDPTRPLRGLNLGSVDMSSENTGADKPGNFGSVDSGHGLMEPSTLAASLAALTPADMSFQAGQFSQSRRETTPIRSATPSTFTGTPSSLAGTPLTTQQATPQSVHSPFLQHTPRPRFAHIASLNGDHMVIFGGRAQDNAPIQEISVLDLTRRVWMIGGDFHAQCCQRMSSLAGVEERPMARRRRRYLECLAGDQQPLEQSTSASPSTAGLPSSSSSSANNSAAFPRLPSTAIPTTSPSSASFLLNPRKNSWHRGEGHPFDLLPVNNIPRHRFKSDSLLSGIEQDDAVWLQSGRPQDTNGVAKTDGLGVDPDISQGKEVKAVSASPPATVDEAAARARQPSVSSAKTTTSKGSSKMSAQEAARKRSQSQSSSSPSIPGSPPVPSPGSRSRSKAPVTHAVSKKFFAKSNGGLMDFEDLATTIARESKARPPVRPKVISVTRSRRSSASTTSSSGSARRGSAATDDSRKTGKTDGKSEKSAISDSRSNLNDSRSNFNDSKSNINDSRSNINDSRSNIKDSKSNVNENKTNVNDLKSEKRKSFGNAFDTVTLSGISLADTIESTEQAAATVAQKLLRPALYLFSNYMGTTTKPRQELIKVQASKTAACARTELNSYDIKPEWTGSYVSDLATRMLAATELAVPPQMLFPDSHIVDNCLLLSGSAVPSTAAGSTSSTTKTTGKPMSGLSHSTESLNQDVQEGATVFSCSDPKTLFSVWMFHFKTHQWTQLELSKSLCAGEWKQSILDRDENYLYLIGTGIQDPRQELAGLEARKSTSSFTSSSSSSSSSGWAPTAFTHLVKVDLEGFGICPEIDEASMGANGAKLGLVMLRDGLGADVVLVSSADGGRVKVNSAMVGQRWGYFQNLMKERESKIKYDSVYHPGPRDEDARLQELTDLPAEIVVRESMPILVAFLQYVYTNELATAHQLKLKSLQGLLLMSRRYDLTRLRQLVLRELHHQLDANNAPAICEVAVLASEFGLQTCALRVLLQSARNTQLRQQGEAAEAKRRLDFAMSRLEEIEEERKRRASAPANHPLHGAAAAAATAAAAAASASGGASSSGAPPRGRTGNTAMFTAQAVPLRTGSGPSSTTTSTTSTPGLGSIGRFFRHREESVDLEHH
ncbi:hypothetical protein EC991_010138 [Linnemannia zychae]|nr:hypothetical protein EC991_010138 [Linnemannia zychae]